MKLKLLIVITILVVIGVAIIAVVKKSNSVPVKPEITEVTTDVQVERKLETDLDSLGGKDENYTKPYWWKSGDEKIFTEEELQQSGDPNLISESQIEKIRKNRKKYKERQINEQMGMDSSEINERVKQAEECFKSPKCADSARAAHKKIRECARSPQCRDSMVVANHKKKNYKWINR